MNDSELNAVPEHDNALGPEGMAPAIEKAELSTYRVPYGDTDQMSVVYYGHYPRYFEMARNELFRKTGMSYKDVESEGMMMPVMELKVHYIKSARYDDLLTFKAWMTWIQGSRFRVDCQILLEDELLVEGYTVHTTVSMDGAPRRFPRACMKYFYP